MTTRTIAQTQSAAGLIGIIAAAFIGAAIIFTAGHVQATALHDAAHDMRHAAGFPCH